MKKERCKTMENGSVTALFYMINNKFHVNYLWNKY